MLSKNVVIKIFNRKIIPTLSGIVLGFAFTLPISGMEDGEKILLRPYEQPVGAYSKLVQSKEGIEKIWTDLPVSSTYYYDSLTIELPSREIDETPLSFTQLSQAYPDLKKLEIKKTSMGSNDRGRLRIQELSENLKTNKTITELMLRQCNVDDEGAEYIADMLKYNTTLLKVILDFNVITDKGAAALASSLQVNKTLTFLSLMCNKQMTDQGITSLGTALYEQYHNPTFQLDVTAVPSQKTWEQKSNFATRLKTKNVIILFQ